MVWVIQLPPKAAQLLSLGSTSVVIGQGSAGVPPSLVLSGPFLVLTIICFLWWIVPCKINQFYYRSKGQDAPANLSWLQ